MDALLSSPVEQLIWVRNLVPVSPLEVDIFTAAWLMPRGCVTWGQRQHAQVLKCDTLNKKPDTLNAFLSDTVPEFISAFSMSSLGAPITLLLYCISHHVTLKCLMFLILRFVFYIIKFLLSWMCSWLALQTPAAIVLFLGLKVNTICNMRIQTAATCR